MHLGHEGDDLAAGDLLDRLGEWASHRHLEGLPGCLDLLPLTGLDQRPLGRDIDVFQEDDDPVALEKLCELSSPASVAVAMESS